MFSFHCRIVNNKLSQSFFHLRIKGFSTTLFFLYLLCMEPSEYIFRMDTKLSSLCSDYFGKTSIWRFVKLLDFLYEFSFKLYSVTSVCNCSFPFFIFFVSSLSFDVFVKLTRVKFGSLFEDFLIDSIEFELTKHDDRIGIFKPFELRDIVLDCSIDEWFGFGREHM